MAWMRFLGCVVTTSLLITFAGCSSDGDGDGDDGEARSCEALCSEGQTGSCTNIKGDCGNFCEALERTAPEAGCADARGDYLSCLSETSNACDTDCSSEEDALESCMTGYCVQHTSDPDCVVLASSF